MPYLPPGWPRAALTLAASLMATTLFAADPVKLTLKKGDHVCFVGNTLADRMNHSGHVEAALYTRFPQLDLTIRNLGFSADELGFSKGPDGFSLRSKNFGTMDQWLSASAPIPKPDALGNPADANPNRFENVGTKADVVFAFYNESWAGPAGLPKFRADLEGFIDHVTSQKYNGKSNCRLVVFSPIAFEDHKTPRLPDGREQNQNLSLYTQAMKQVCDAKDTPFVDLFTPTLAAYAQAKSPLTINGVHMDDEGYAALAPIVGYGLFGSVVQVDAAKYARVLAAVNDKNHYWFQRYRATDGYSTFGDRAFLKFVGGQTNYEVGQRELTVIDTLVANRDKAIQAAAKGEAYTIDDSNTPPFLKVVTNKPGNGPNGTHLFLSGEDAIKSMTLGKDLRVNLFADESMFPELASPNQMAFDAAGRLWVSTWPTYPHWKPKTPMDDRLIVLEDTDGDGKADTCKTFAGGLHNVTGFDFVEGGVIVAQGPDILLLKDTDGDGVADVRKRIINGVDTADTHHTSNSFVLDPGGAVYMQEGTFHQSQVETPYGPPRRLSNAGSFRYEPKTQKFDIYITYGFANPHGHVFDRWGRDIIVDGTGANPYDAALISGYLPYPQKHPRAQQVYQQRTRPCGGVEILSSSHFPEEFRSNLVVTNCIGFLGLLRYKIEPEGSTLKGTELEPFLTSTDPNFRPVDVKTGPDGAIYFIDWQNPIIGHMQHNLRDPSRDATHGRVYRVTHADGAKVKPAKVSGQPVEALLALLKSPDDRVRSRAKIELGARNTTEVIAAVKAWDAALVKSDPEYDHDHLEALWVHQYHDTVDVELLKSNLAAKTPEARAAAVRVLLAWADRVPQGQLMLLQLAEDPSPRVRLEAVKAASYFRVPEAIEVVLVAQQSTTDAAMDYECRETMKSLDPIVQTAVASGKPVRFATPAGAKYFLKSVPTERLLTLARTPLIDRELLTRPAVRDEVRRASAAALATAEKSTPSKVVLAALKSQDGPALDESVAYDLARLLTDRGADLAAGRAELEAVAETAKTPLLRQIGWVALVSADGTPDKVWAKASKSLRGLRDLVTAVPQVRDPNLRAAFYPKALALLDGLPPELAAKAGQNAGVSGRYVRIEIPGNERTLTLAEVEVFSDGRNVARGGKATQHSTVNGASARRAIDGNKSGAFNDGGQTHSRENVSNPWWELDLSRAMPIDAVAVFNRTDSNLGDRLKNFTLKVLDAKRQVVFEKKMIPSPAPSVTVVVGGESPARVIQAAAMTALTTVRGKEADAYNAIAKFVADPATRSAAIQALQRIPVKAWPAEAAPALMATVTDAVAKVAEAQRTTPAVVESLQFADALAGLLPRDQAKAARKKLGELGVRVIRVGTLTDQMLFDRDRITVQAGKPVEFEFQNTDIMPHNFAVLLPGSLEEVGNAAEAFGVTPGAQAKNFLPPSDKILLGSKLLQPRESQALRFNVPSKPGVYPYVCTYPGHWRRMYGALYVVADLDEYLADPEGYLAKNPLPIQDELLKFIRPRTEWKFEELAGALPELAGGGRSFAHGKQLFSVASCVSCHKFGGQGQDFGPDLSKLDPKVFQTPADLLKHVLDPSLRIEDKYRTYTFNLASGATVTGMVLEKTPTGDYKVIENPLTKADTKLVKKDDLDGDPKPSLTSMMPKGLLDKFTKDEVLDILAYVLSNADPKSRYFAGDHHGK
jgi:putative heme-binding domain-containing protein